MANHSSYGGTWWPTIEEVVGAAVADAAELPLEVGYGLLKPGVREQVVASRGRIGVCLTQLP